MSYPVFWAKAEVEADAIEKRLRQFLAASDSTSAKLIDEVEIAVSPVTYHKFVFCECTYEASWSGSFGYARTEYEYYFDSAGNQQRRSIEKVDWRPEHGTDSGVVSYFLPGASSINEKLLGYAYRCSRPKLTVCKEEDVLKDAFDVPTEHWFTARAEAFERDRVGNQLSRFIKGNKLKDWVTNWTSKKTYRKCYLPIAQASFTWKGKVYSYYCGAWQDAEVLGDVPPKGLLDSFSGQVLAACLGTAAFYFPVTAFFGLKPSGGFNGLGNFLTVIWILSIIAGSLAWPYHRFREDLQKSATLKTQFTPKNFLQKVFLHFPTEKLIRTASYGLLATLSGCTLSLRIATGDNPGQGSPLHSAIFNFSILVFCALLGAIVFVVTKFDLNAKKQRAQEKGEDYSLTMIERLCEYIEKWKP